MSTHREPTKPFRFRDLPEDIMNRVFKQMDTIEIIEFSLQSEKSRQLIKHHKLEAKTLTFNNDWISMDFSWLTNPFFVTFGADPENIHGYRRINMSTYFCSKNDDENIFSVTNKDTKSYMVLYDYFQDLFKIRNLACDVTRVLDRNLIYQLPKEVKSLKIGEEMSGELEISTVLDKFEVKENMEIDGQITDLHPKMLTVPSIYFGDVTKLKIEKLTKLKNEKIDIFQHEFSNENVNFLVKHWKKSDTNLEYLKINDETETFDLDQILDGMDPQPWNPEKRDQIYQLDSEDVDCQEYVDIERDSDGRLASIGLVGPTFEMFVWKVPFRPVEEEMEEETEEEKAAREKMGGLQIS